MARSEQINELIAALAKARPHFKSIPKAATNKYGGYDYATLEDILEAITPALSEQGLVPYFDTAYDDDHHETGVETYLFHTSGQWLSTLIWLGTPEVETKANTALSVPQRIGVALTYGRKYGLCMVTAVQPGGEDDDAQSALSKPTHDASQPLARGPAKAARGWPTDGAHTSPETMTQAGIDPAEQKSIERHEAKENRAQGIMPPTVRASDPTWLNPEAAFAAIQQRLSVLAGSHEETQVMPYVQLAWGTGMTSLSQLSRQGKSSLNRGLARLNAMPVPGDDRSPAGDPPVDPPGSASMSAGEPPQGTTSTAQEHPPVTMAGKESTNTTSASGSTAMAIDGANSHPGSSVAHARRREEPLAKDMVYTQAGFLVPDSEAWLRAWAEQAFAADAVDFEIRRWGGIDEGAYARVKAEVHTRERDRRAAEAKGQQP
jgi:hypothetical protein